MNIATLEQKIKSFISALDDDTKAFIIGLGHLAPELTTAAVIAESVTGNAELIPVTAAAGKAAEVIGNDVSQHGLVESVADAKLQVETVIKANGA